MNDKKVMLSMLWIFAVLNYLYADVLTLLFNPAMVQEAKTLRARGVQPCAGDVMHGIPRSMRCSAPGGLMGYAARTTYRRPGRVRRFANGFVAWLAGIGLTPADTVRLEVAGRRTGRTRAFAVTMAILDGEPYLVSLAGESDWVRNLRAAGGKAVIRHHRRTEVRVEEVPVEQCASVLAAYLSKRALSKSASAAARDYFGVDAHPSLAALLSIASHYPVFKVIGVDWAALCSAERAKSASRWAPAGSRPPHVRGLQVAVSW